MTTTPISEKSDLISHSTVFYEKEGKKLSFCYELFQQTVRSDGKITEKRVYLPREEWEKVVNPKIRETLEKTAAVGSKILAPKEIKFSESRTSVISSDGSTNDSASDQTDFFRTIKPKISHEPPRPVEKPRPAPVTLSPTLVARPVAPPAPLDPPIVVPPTPPAAPAVSDAAAPKKPPTPPVVPAKTPAKPAKTSRPSAPPALVVGKPLSTETAFKIENSGNDCFINSFLQMILSNPELTEAIVETKDENLKELINFLTQKPKRSGWFGRGPEDALTGSKEIRACLNRLSRTTGFSGRVQQDSFDAYTVLMTYLSEKHPAQFEPFLCLQRTTISTVSTPQYSLTPDKKKKKIAREFQVADEGLSQSAHIGFSLINTPKKGTLQKTVNFYFHSTQRENQEVDDQSSPGSKIEYLVQRKTNVRIDKAPEQLNINLQGVGSPIDGIKKFFLSRSYVEGSGKDTKYGLVGFSVYTGDAKTGKSGHWYSYREIGKRYYELNDLKVRECSEDEFFRIASTSARHLVYRKKT